MKLDVINMGAIYLGNHWNFISTCYRKNNYRRPIFFFSFLDWFVNDEIFSLVLVFFSQFKPFLTLQAVRQFLQFIIWWIFSGALWVHCYKPRYWYWCDSSGKGYKRQTNKTYCCSQFDILSSVFIYGIFIFSLSSGEDHLEKLQELERLLAQAQQDKMKILEDQVSIPQPLYNTIPGIQRKVLVH